MVYRVPPRRNEEESAKCTSKGLIVGILRHGKLFLFNHTAGPLSGPVKPCAFWIFRHFGSGVADNEAQTIVADSKVKRGARVEKSRAVV